MAAPVSASSVCVLAAGDGSPEFERALQVQTATAGRRVDAASRHEAVSAGVDSGAAWLWLLDTDLAPRVDALERLLGAAAEAGDDLPEPALLVSKVVREDGTLDPDRAPWPPLLDREAVIAAARHRLVSLRLARFGSLLVSREAVLRHGPPRADLEGGAADLEWTARILRDERGYLAPRSVAVRRSPPTGLRGAEVRDRLKMVRSDAWVAQEPVWFAFMLAVDVLRAAGGGLSSRRRRARP